MNLGYEPPPIVTLPDESVRPVASDGLNLQCRIWGPEDGFPIVLLHGLRGYSGTWRSFASHYHHRYRLIALDQRGRGGSDWDPQRNYYTDAYVSDLQAVVEHFSLRRFVLLGHSMGGTTAYVYTAHHPERVAALIVEDMAPGASIKGAGATRVMSEMASLPDDFPSWESAYGYWRAARPSVDERAIEQRLAETLEAGPDGRIHWRFDSEGIKQVRLAPDPARTVDLWPIIERIARPALVIRGELSDFCPEASAREMIRRNPLFDYATVKGAGHYVHDDSPAQFLAHVDEFLGRQAGQISGGHASAPSPRARG